MVDSEALVVPCGTPWVPICRMRDGFSRTLELDAIIHEAHGIGYCVSDLTVNGVKRQVDPALDHPL